MGIICCSQNNEWSNIILEEGSNISMPIEDDIDEIWPTGISIDFTPNSKLPGEMPESGEIPPSPIIQISTNAGILLCYHCILSVPPSDLYFSRMMKGDVKELVNLKGISFETKNNTATPTQKLLVTSSENTDFRLKFPNPFEAPDGKVSSFFSNASPAPAIPKPMFENSSDNQNAPKSTGIFIQPSDSPVAQRKLEAKSEGKISAQVSKPQAFGDFKIPSTPGNSLSSSTNKTETSAGAHFIRPFPAGAQISSSSTKNHSSPLAQPPLENSQISSSVESDKTQEIAAASLNEMYSAFQSNFGMLKDMYNETMANMAQFSQTCNDADKVTMGNIAFLNKMIHKIEIRVKNFFDDFQNFNKQYEKIKLSQSLVIVQSDEFQKRFDAVNKNEKVSTERQLAPNLERLKNKLNIKSNKAKEMLKTIEEHIKNEKSSKSNKAPTYFMICSSLKYSKLSLENIAGKFRELNSNLVEFKSNASIKLEKINTTEKTEGGRFGLYGSSEYADDNFSEDEFKMDPLVEEKCDKLTGIREKMKKELKSFDPIMNESVQICLVDVKTRPIPTKKTNNELVKEIEHIRAEEAKVSDHIIRSPTIKESNIPTSTPKNMKAEISLKAPPSAGDSFALSVASSIEPKFTKVESSLISNQNSDIFSKLTKPMHDEESSNYSHSSDESAYEGEYQEDIKDDIEDEEAVVDESQDISESSDKEYQAPHERDFSDFLKESPPTSSVLSSTGKISSIPITQLHSEASPDMFSCLKTSSATSKIDSEAETSTKSVFGVLPSSESLFGTMTSKPLDPSIGKPLPKTSFSFGQAEKMNFDSSKTFQIHSPANKSTLNQVLCEKPLESDDISSMVSPPNFKVMSANPVSCDLSAPPENSNSKLSLAQAATISSSPLALPEGLSDIHNASNIQNEKVFETFSKKSLTESENSPNKITEVTEHINEPNSSNEKVTVKVSDSILLPVKLVEVSERKDLVQETAIDKSNSVQDQKIDSLERSSKDEQENKTIASLTTRVKTPEPTESASKSGAVNVRTLPNMGDDSSNDLEYDQIIVDDTPVIDELGSNDMTDGMFYIYLDVPINSQTAANGIDDTQDIGTSSFFASSKLDTQRIAVNPMFGSFANTSSTTASPGRFGIGAAPSSTQTAVSFGNASRNSTVTPSSFGTTSTPNSAFGTSSSTQKAMSFGNASSNSTVTSSSLGTISAPNPAFGAAPSFGSGFPTSNIPERPVFGSTSFSSSGASAFGSTGFATTNPVFGSSGFSKAGAPTFGSSGFGAAPSPYSQVRSESLATGGFASHAGNSNGFAELTNGTNNSVFGQKSSGNTFGQFGTGSSASQQGFGNSVFGATGSNQTVFGSTTQQNPQQNAFGTAQSFTSFGGSSSM